MALTIEDGTGVAGATSYATLAEARAYASARGLSLPAQDADLEVLLRRAAEFLDTLGRRYLGTWLYGPGYLQWPRNDVFIDGFAVGTDEIPLAVKNAQCQLAVELQTVDPLASSPVGAAVQSESVSATSVSTTYAVGKAPPLPELPKVKALLAPVLRTGVTVTR